MFGSIGLVALLCSVLGAIIGMILGHLFAVWLSGKK